MTTRHPQRDETPADQFGRRVAARLAAGSEDLPYEVRERLRAARMQALALRKPEAARRPFVVGRGASASIALGKEEWSLWHRVASVLPIVVLAAGLVFLHVVQTERRASEIAEVDADLLTDDLPPAAYADPGFVQYLKSGHE